MRVLHLFSDWKWTGPAEPVVDLIRTLASRGIDARLACSPAPAGFEDSIEKNARARGVEPVTSFRLAKHFHLFQNLRDAEALSRYIDAEQIDIVHTHRLQDHWVAAGALRRIARRVPLVRTCHDSVPQKKNLRNWILYRRRRTDLLIDICREGYREDGSTFRLNRRIVYIPPAVDTDRFDAAKVQGDLRREFGIAPDAVVIGIVARIQPKRRFDILLEAFRRVSNKYDKARLMIVGRGTRMESVAVRPVKRFRIENRVIFAGYRRDDYLEALRTFDVKVFMVPGTDGSCRAVLQSMSMGLPIVTTTLGILPELVHDGINGYLASNMRAGDFAEAFGRLLRNPVHRTRMGQASRRIALERYTLDAQAKRVEAEYQKLLERSQIAVSESLPP